MFSVRCHHFVRSISNIQNISLESIPLGGAFQHRHISTAKILQQNYYDALGITANSTQNDIKAAYYKLSMIYHPDKNQGSESAAKKFREITQAYEVLSNYRLRRLYDKGIIHTAGEQYARKESDASVEDDIEDDPQTKFYKSRFSKSKVSNTKGQTPIYDFDEWAKAHYGKSFERRKEAKNRYDRKAVQREHNKFGLQNEIMIFLLVIGTVIIYLVAHAEQSYDTPKTKQESKEE